MDTTGEQRRERDGADSRAIVDRLAWEIIRSASPLPAAQAAVRAVIEAEIALLKAQRQVAGWARPRRWRGGGCTGMCGEVSSQVAT